MPALLAISFATQGAYESEIERLASSCARWNVPLVRETISTLGSWKRNCAYKPRFIRKMLDAYPGQSLLWLDADAEVQGDVSAIASLQCDIAARTCLWPHPSHPHLLSGTILIQPTPAARITIAKWCELQTGEVTDQRVLEKAVAETKPIIVDLDPRYVAIIDETPAIDRPLIVHHQASRRLRRVMTERA